MLDLSVACQRGIEVETAVHSQRGKNYLSEVRTRFLCKTGKWRHRRAG